MDKLNELRRSELRSRRNSARNGNGPRGVTGNRCLFAIGTGHEPFVESEVYVTRKRLFRADSTKRADESKMRKKVKFYYDSHDAEVQARATTYKVPFQHEYIFCFDFATRSPLEDKKRKKEKQYESTETLTMNPVRDDLFPGADNDIRNIPGPT